MNAQALVRPSDRFAVFWGGGLGDILVIRPLLMALARRLEHPPYFFTTASHLEGVFEALDLKVDLKRLPASPRDALRVFRELGVRFDWIYLGPRPRLKTRLLATMVGAERIWSVQHPEVPEFLGEQVLADMHMLGLTESGEVLLPYGGRWDTGAKPDKGDYLVLHVGAKGRWETKQWPEQKWRALTVRLLEAPQLRLVLVGTPSEATALARLAEGSDADGRVEMRTDLPLAGLADCIEGSRGVICHNSGVMHLTAMLGMPAVVLTGSSPQRWRPPYPNVLNLDSGRCGLACDQYRCPVPFYRARCIRELEVETVLEAVRSRLLS